MAPHSIQWRDLESTTSSGCSRRSGGSETSDESYRARSRTNPMPRNQRPPLPSRDTWHGPTEHRYERYHAEPAEYYERESVETYASTSEEEQEEEEEDDYPPYEVPEYRHEVYPTDAIPATPRDFAELFPSSNRLSIRHDDATIDGNMNLRIDTQVETRRGKQLVTLFHLRMHDLKSRDFSLRRYCRESGREVCHCIRKYQKPPSERPALQRSFSSAIATFRHKPERKNSDNSSLRRQDSGYGSIATGATADDEKRPKSSAGQPKRAQLLPTNTVKLEFSNYAHVDVKRRGTKSSKRYEFEYWGVNYSWKRVSKKDGSFDEVSYHLMRSDSPTALAHIVPVPLTNSQAREEAAKGGWIPPCSMWISDQSIIDGGADTADVIIASGIMTLVDDSIKNHFHSKQSTQLHIPLSRNASFKLNMDYVGPKRLIDEVFHRTTRGSTSPRGPTPLRRTSIEG